MKSKFFILTLLFTITSFILSTQASSGQAQANLNSTSSSTLTPGWTLISSDQEMANRGMRTVYDSQRNVVVMFGGWMDSDALRTNRTWEFNGSVWNQVYPPNVPPSRIWHGMTYDSARQVVVVYGGEGESGNLFDTWEYNGSTWTQINTTHYPENWYGFGMTFDSCRNKVVLYGGAGDSSLTWEYDGSDWQQVTTPAYPSSTFLTALAFDSARCRSVLFGGGNDETWEYDGTDWEQITTAQKPVSRWAHAMAYNPTSEKIVLFGGYGPEYPEGSELGDTWEYDGKNWIETSPAYSPSPREQHAMAYEGHHKRTLLFGGFGNGETWLYGLTGRVFLPMLSKYGYTCMDRPLLLWPRNGSTINTLLPNYLWDTCSLPGAIEIELLISPNVDMSNWVLGLAAPSTGLGNFQDIENLAPNTIYYWQMRARYTNEDYGPASTGSFRTPASGILLPPPILISPADGTNLSGTSVTFTWQPVSGAEKYQLVISNPEKTSMYFRWVYGTDSTFSYLEQSQPYIWYVSAVNEYAIGQPSAEWDFTSGATAQAMNQPESSLLDRNSHTLSWLPQSEWVRVTAP